MKVTVALYKQEGFTQHVALLLDNGLTLVNKQKLVWAGKDEADKVVLQVRQLLAALKQAGFQVENEELLDHV